MKQQLTYFTAGMVITSLLAFTPALQTIEVKKTTANAEIRQGIVVFIHAEPVAPYKYLGTYAPKVVWSKDAAPIIEHMIKKGKEQFPETNAIIFRDDEMGVADMVKIEE